MKHKKIILDPEEQAIEDGMDFTPVSLKEKRRIEKIIDAARKNRTISLRISDYDLGKLKERAAQEGMPYQTLINSVLHKYVTNQLHDDREVLHVVRAIQAPYGKGPGKD